MSAETLEAIGERHNLHAEEISPLEDVGIFNSIYLVGSEYVLRVPRVAPPFVAAIRKESVAVPAARAAGVRTPALVVLDDSLEILPVPYAIYERVHGETLGMLDFGPEDTPRIWHQVGRDLARLHEGVDEYGPVRAALRPEADAGRVGIGRILHRRGGPLAFGMVGSPVPLRARPSTKAFRHGDL